jgi:RNA polymerase sigma factor (sigma-70 family)
MPGHQDPPRAGGFPTTQWSAVVGARSADAAERERSCGHIVAAYWKPVYKHIRLRWRRSPEDAQDLTQEFFLRAFDKGWFAPYDPARARFRTFLRTCLDGFLANEEKASRRQKRGGDVTILPLAFDRAEGELAAADLPAAGSPERSFDAEWARSLFEMALEGLRRACDTPERRAHLDIFERYDLGDPAGDRPTYEELGRPHGLSAAQVTHHLAWARRELRRLLLETLRSLTATEEEFRREARELLGIDPS